MTHLRLWLCAALGAIVCNVSVFGAEIGPTNSLEAAAAALPGGSSSYVVGDGISINMVVGNYNGARPIDPFRAAVSALIGAGDSAYISAIDFNGNPRGGNPDAGAYAFDPNGNQGWAITTGFKTITRVPKVPMPPEDVRAD